MTSSSGIIRVPSLSTQTVQRWSVIIFLLKENDGAFNLGSFHSPNFSLMPLGQLQLVYGLPSLTTSDQHLYRGPGQQGRDLDLRGHSLRDAGLVHPGGVGPGPLLPPHFGLLSGQLCRILPLRTFHVPDCQWSCQIFTRFVEVDLLSQQCYRRGHDVKHQISRIRNQLFRAGWSIAR